MRTILSLFPGLMSGRRLADEGELQQLLMLTMSSQAGMVASGSPPGPMVNSAINQFASGAHFQLPTALAGRQLMVINNGNINDMTAHPQPTNSANNNLPDTIDGVDTSDVPVRTASTFVCYVTGTWVNITSDLALLPP